jgi:hypothetical protein
VTSITGSFDLASRTWTHLTTPDDTFCSGVSVLANGSAVIMGGNSLSYTSLADFPDGRFSIRTFTDGDPGLVLAGDMQFARWYPTVTLLQDRTVLVMGGTEYAHDYTAIIKYYEIWDPQVRQILDLVLSEWISLDLPAGSMQMLDQ